MKTNARGRRPMAFAMACALGFVAPAALAQPTPRSQSAVSPSDAATADAAFRAGRAAAARGDWSTACPKFAESQRLDPAAGTLLNLATCEQHLGRLATALRHARETVQQLAPSDDRVTIAKALVADLERRVPRLTLRLAPNAPSDMTVTFDGTDVDRTSLGVALPIDPGSHSIAANAAGRRERRIDVTAAEGQSMEIAVEAGPAADGAAASTGAGSESTPPTDPSTPPDTTPIAPSSGSTGRTVGFVVGGIGLASLVVGGVTGAMVFAKKSTVEQHCSANKACDPIGLDAGSSGKTLATVSTVTVAAGAALLATGIVVVLASGGKGPSTTVGVALAPHQSTMNLGGQF